MGLEDLTPEPGCKEPYKRIHEQIVEGIDGSVKRQESGDGYTYYVGVERRGRAFVTVQPNIWIYFDPSVKSSVDAAGPPSVVVESELFEPVPECEKFKSSFGHRVKIEAEEACELPEEVLQVIRQIYAQVRRSTLRS